MPGTEIALKAHTDHSAGALVPDGRHAGWPILAETALGPLTLGIAYVDTDLTDLLESDATLLLSVATES